MAPAGNTSFESWGGNVGFNFEVANLVWLSEQGDASAGPVEEDELVESFIIAGAQGSRDGENLLEVGSLKKITYAY